jgi:hypothetical protein
MMTWRAFLPYWSTSVRREYRPDEISQRHK